MYYSEYINTEKYRQTVLFGICYTHFQESLHMAYEIAYSL